MGTLNQNTSKTAWEFLPNITITGDKVANATATLNTAGKYLDKDIVIKAGSANITAGKIGSVSTASNISTTTTNSDFKYIYKGTVSSAGYVDSSITDDATIVNISSATIGNAATLPEDKSDNEFVLSSANAVPSGGYLKINEGYIKDTYISLDSILGGKEDTAGIAESQILGGYTAYDADGNLLTGTMSTVSMQPVVGNGIKIDTGYVTASTLNIDSLLANGAITTASPSTSYFTTSTSGSVAASGVGEGYLTSKQYIIAGSISTYVSGGNITGTAAITPNNVTLSTSDTSSGISIQPTWSASRAAVTSTANISKAGWLTSGKRYAVLSSASDNGSGNPQYITALTVGEGKKLSITNSGTLTVNNGGDKGASFSGKTATIDGTVVTDANGDLLTSSCTHSNLSAGWVAGPAEEITPSVTVKVGTTNVGVTSTASGKSYVVIDPGASVTKAASGTVQPSFNYDVNSAGWLAKTSTTQTYQAASTASVTLNAPQIKAGSNRYIEIYNGDFTAAAN